MEEPIEAERGAETEPEKEAEKVGEDSFEEEVTAAIEAETAALPPPPPPSAKKKLKKKCSGCHAELTILRGKHIEDKSCDRCGVSIPACVDTHTKCGKPGAQQWNSNMRKWTKQSPLKRKTPEASASAPSASSFNLEETVALAIRTGIPFKFTFELGGSSGGSSGGLASASAPTEN